MQPVSDWGQATLAGVAAAMTAMIGYIPVLLAAIIIFAIGWFLGSGLGKLVAKLLRSAGFEALAERIGIRSFLNKAGVQRMDASAVAGAAVTWIIRLVFLQVAAEALGLRQITQIINAMIAFIPNIIVAVLILGVAGFFGKLLQGIVRGSAVSAGATNAGFLSSLAYWGIMAFGIIAALNQLQIAPLVVNTLFIGLVATLVLALGLSFGLGGREVAADMTREWSEKARAMASPTGRPSPYRDQLTQPHPQEYEDIVPPLGSNAPGMQPTSAQMGGQMPGQMGGQPQQMGTSDAVSATPPHQDPMRRVI